jgi:hypothetical protein
MRRFEFALDAVNEVVIGQEIADDSVIQLAIDIANGRYTEHKEAGKFNITRGWGKIIIEVSDESLLRRNVNGAHYKPLDSEDVGSVK